ncbi:MAG TPA: GNAT family N-acetyltransferase, partial [Bryobacteraceae bacterium]|nr:GNAT family N-acetyltransferase [Bryobacteraceae bacterium]
YLKRIEAQLMMMKGPFERHLPLSAFSQVYPRILMLFDLAAIGELQPGRAASAIKIVPWSESRHEEAALLIAASYQGHIDSSINDQYRSYSGAKRFISNIVQYPGCGSFFEGGSLLAEDKTGHLCGLVLSSMVASDVGHITQICVAPELTGKGIGYEIMRAALLRLAANRCERASLTVTASNAVAIQLYQNMGFRATRRFAAYVWDGF